MSDEEQKQALILWVAYQENGDKKNYLGDGKGNVRLFRNEESIKEYLQAVLTPEQLEATVIHSIAGHIVVPEPEAEQPLPISTLAFDSLPPTVQDQLNEMLKRKGIL
jgi:hypothetical protein